MTQWLCSSALRWVCREHSRTGGVRDAGETAAQEDANRDRYSDRRRAASDGGENGQYVASHRLVAAPPDSLAGVAVLDRILVRVVSDMGRDGVTGCGSYLRHRQLLSGGIHATTAASNRAGIGDGATRLKLWGRDDDRRRV